MRGKLKWYNGVKGYGFIIGDEDGKDYFFHFLQLRCTKADKNRLPDHTDIQMDFDPEQGEKGRCAKNVRLAQELPAKPVKTS